ncbi:MAG: thiamine-phosphate kinase [Candidatus Porifericomitaceae bacterium WSBS_2022_MAG_OTU9]
MAGDWESAVVRRFLQRPGSGRGVLRGIGDDAALLDLPAGEVLAVSMDTIVEGKHFPKHLADSSAIGYLALAVNLSDLAATAATPYAAFLSLTIPEADDVWLQAFATGFHELAELHGVELAGGDITCGPRTISVTVCGSVPQQEALARNSAKPGDLVYVTGSLGGAALGYSHMRGDAPVLDDEQLASCMQRLLRPQPRIAEGLCLRQVASSCTDLSDGLSRNLSLLLEASGCGADIYLQKLPLDENVASLIPPPQCWQMALAFGGDYELCCTVPAKKAYLLDDRNFSLVGEVCTTPGLRFVKPDGGLYKAGGGYSHFAV